MSETRPRDLTAVEQQLQQAPPTGGADSAPLAVPPGTEVPVHLLDPTAVAAPPAAPSAPTQGPPDHD